MSKKNKQYTKKGEGDGDVLGVIAIIVIIIAIVLICLGLFGKGFGFGNGNGSGDGTGTGSGISDSAESSVSEDSGSPEVYEPETTTITEPEITYIEVIVSGSSYLMNGTESTIDEITQSADNENTVIRINDDNAIADSMDALISALDNAGVSYVSQN